MNSTNTKNPFQLNRTNLNAGTYNADKKRKYVTTLRLLWVYSTQRALALILKALFPPRVFFLQHVKDIIGQTRTPQDFVLKCSPGFIFNLEFYSRQ